MKKKGGAAQIAVSYSVSTNRNAFIAITAGDSYSQLQHNQYWQPIGPSMTRNESKIAFMIIGKMIVISGPVAEMQSLGQQLWK